MDGNVHDSITTNADALTISALNMLHPWPHVDSTNLPHAQWHTSYLDNWSRTTSARPIEHHGSFPSVPFQTQAWHYPNQEHTDSQRIQADTSWTSEPGPSTVMTMPNDDDISQYNIDVPALVGSGAYQSTNTAPYGAVSREPYRSGHSVIGTTSQG